ncbi:hypothetical protein Lal_00032016 [Lupinus albus]|uniref:Putative RNA recognition motif domain-containing protein n=1 Tax=Lupinus albus TaxID=3870 RepID=A0A6A5LX10_LUPAL|nr:putative RNA recognition motif domain-containing protein [Lupinus albus]KAF1864698.1 hypothetical protein Lal_00032016 [Lupinus albus]
MTMDDECSIYVGGIPYDTTEDTIRTIFNLYGAILDIKIINDQRTAGKCYCFVTFTNPRSAIDAITDMNGRSIGGRAVMVNGVKTRGGRSSFGREHHRRNFERNEDWDHGRGRDQDYDHDRVIYRDRHSDRSRERDRSREHDRSRGHDRDRDRGFEHMHNYDNEKEPFVDDDRSRDEDFLDNKQEHNTAHGQEKEGEQNLDFGNWSKIDRTSDPDRSFGEDQNNHSRRSSGLYVTNQHSMDHPSDSNGNHDDQVEDQLKHSTQRLDQLKNEVSQMEEKLEEKRLLTLELQKKSRKIEDALISVKKQSSYRQMQLIKLHNCVLQVKDYSERLKASEKELQTLVDTTVLENDDVTG